MTREESGPIIDQIRAQFRALGKFYDEPTEKVYRLAISRHSAGMVKEIVASYLRNNPRDVMTAPELENLIRDANSRVVAASSLSQAEQYRLLPPGQRTTARQQWDLFIQGYVDGYRKNHGGEDIPKQLRRQFDRIRENLSDTGGSLKLSMTPFNDGFVRTMDDLVDTIPVKKR